MHLFQDLSLSAFPVVQFLSDRQCLKAHPYFWPMGREADKDSLGQDLLLYQEEF